MTKDINIQVDLEFMKDVFDESIDLTNVELNLKSRFEEVPGWDSLGHISIISEIETRLNIEFDIDEIIGQDTVKKLIDMVNNKL
tara:strand:- start:6094 stop:6345 length:252 start_codon:yes stop_codon:yes gene_type:complete